MRVSLRVILPARATEEMRDLLTILLLSSRHASSVGIEALAGRAVSGLSEAPSSPDTSVSCYRVLEHVRVVPVVVPKRELVQVEREILAADVVIGPHDASLQQAPKLVQIGRMDLPANVLTAAVGNPLVVVTMLRQPDVDLTLIGRDQINLLADRLFHERVQRVRVGRFDQLADDVPLAGNRADYGHFRATATDANALADVPILVLSADLGFVHFDDTHEFLKLGIGETGTQPMAEVPRRLIAARPDHPVNLPGGHTLLAGQHVVQDLEPRSQGIVRVLEDRAHVEREAVGVGVLFGLANPVERAGLQRVHLLALATLRAIHAVFPSLVGEILFAGRFVRKHLVELAERHLADLRLLFWLFRVFSG